MEQTWPEKSKHAFVGAMGNPNQCVKCGYSEKSHTSDAECEACGTNAECGFYPNDKPSPQRILMCWECFVKEIEAHQRNMEYKKQVATAANIKSPGAYFANQEPTPAIQDIVELVNSDESIPANRKNERMHELVKERIANFQASILSFNEKIRALQSNENQAQIYLNYLAAQIGDARMKELGFTNVISLAKPKKDKKSDGKAPSTKRMSSSDLEQLKRTCASENIPIDAIRVIMVQKNLSADGAVKFYKEILFGAKV